MNLAKANLTKNMRIQRNKDRKDNYNILLYKYI